MLAPCFEFSFRDEGLAPLVLQATLDVFQADGMRLLTPANTLPARLQSGSVVASVAANASVFVAVLATRGGRRLALPLDVVIERVPRGLRVVARPRAGTPTGLVVSRFRNLMGDVVSRLEAGAVDVSVSDLFDAARTGEPPPHLR